MSNTDMLVELLAEIFSEKDLRKFVRQYRQGKLIYPKLPDDTDDIEELAYAVVNEWAKKALVNEELRDRLKAICPDDRTTIDEVFEEILEGNFQDSFEDEEDEDDDDDDDLNDMDFEEEGEESFDEDDFEEDEDDFDEDDDFEEDEDFEGDDDFEDEEFEEEEDF